MTQFQGGAATEWEKVAFDDLPRADVDGHDEATNSPTRGRGSFARAMRAVALAKEAGIPFRVMQVLTRSTADTATEFYDHFAAIGCSPGFFMVK
ncbi:hypothetical protein [[Pseudopropionibacterium] massiliense]|uniref:hypothetical protein n=1 Tax=[Pseudopropionibacterium] massiliense TaxID=2220000 RepID=UPI00102F79C0|nr:hypothetical protein [[Pseudopropionibacterium] massiliense]